MEKGVNVLCIVAHPDDETIWMGGTILKNKDWDWTILSLCRKYDEDRNSKFKMVCSYYNAKSIILDLDDEILNPLSIEFIIGKIKENISKKKFHKLYTHGKNGEYGHLRHKEIHLAIKKMIKDNDLLIDEIYYFSYIYGKKNPPRNPELKIPESDKNADIKIELTDNELNEKIKIVTDIYGFDKDSFEALSCNKIEAFNLEK